MTTGKDYLLMCRRGKDPRYGIRSVLRPLLAPWPEFLRREMLSSLERPHGPAQGDRVSELPAGPYGNAGDKKKWRESRVRACHLSLWLVSCSLTSWSHWGLAECKNWSPHLESLVRPSTGYRVHIFLPLYLNVPFLGIIFVSTLKNRNTSFAGQFSHLEMI